ncbi:MAG: M20/M25/M40 family metallo-hydrolase [Coriobacteriaceae bacterium]|jgi:tripeptide aminopeptidase|nr:M20/M25/M40 family metallo-hydrolase [Coriobacteriaceae bacterium]
MDAQRLLDTFITLVGIDSPSRSEARVAAFCAQQLEGLGFVVRFDGAQETTGSDTGNLIAFLPGKPEANPSVTSEASSQVKPGDNPPVSSEDNPSALPAAGLPAPYPTDASGLPHIALSAHMDCVDPCKGVIPLVQDGVIRSSGETVLGADDKAGIAAILEALRTVIEEGLARPSITVLLTTCEELSLLGASALADDVFPAQTPCFVLDADGSPGTIIKGAPYHYSLTAHFFGKAAHAGVAPEEGASAVQMAACAISSMRLGRLGEHATANIGIIEGGREINIIPDSCTLKGECRSLHQEEAKAIRDDMTQACKDAAQGFGGRVEVLWRLDYPGILYDECDPLIAKLSAAARAAGVEPVLAVSGGGADTNLIAAKGARAITLGIGMTAFHSLEEHITVKDLEDTARFVEEIVRGFTGQ